jgi:hypothetical protein
MNKNWAEWKASGSIPAVPNVDWGSLQEKICYRLIRDSGMSENEAIQFSDDIVALIHDWIMAQSYHNAQQQFMAATAPPPKKADDLEQLLAIYQATGDATIRKILEEKIYAATKGSDLG